MTSRRTYDREGHAHFVTFSWDRRRRLLDHERPRAIVLDLLTSQREKPCGRCVGFVVMPDHVPAIVRFPAPDPIAHFRKPWKQRSSIQIKRLLRDRLTAYASHIEPTEPVWQSRDDGFNLFTERKVEEKLATIHQNPVRAGLVPARATGPGVRHALTNGGRT